MTIEQLVPLTNGLSLTACNETLMLDGARITPLPDSSVEMAFRIAGTDLVPRFRLSRRHLASSSLEDMTSIVRHVASRAFGCAE
jgi:hypothetical protein